MQRRCNIDSVTTRSNYEMEDERRTIGRGVDSTGRMDNYVFRESNESHERRSYRSEQNARSRRRLRGEWACGGRGGSSSNDKNEVLFKTHRPLDPHSPRSAPTAVGPADSREPFTRAASKALSLILTSSRQASFQAFHPAAS
ncbi:hypothetical protein HZH68_010600 [Vespula germanica]|uniref:Uncharacterized protein n=1 Tax=Vespula germanica TaxID=30212 RepID=A0A834JY60_VESGE|nr:hypothetical protein HZH68_010600 [Vespula germanica]